MSVVNLTSGESVDFLDESGDHGDLWIEAKLDFPIYDKTNGTLWAVRIRGNTTDASHAGRKFDISNLLINS